MRVKKLKELVFDIFRDMYRASDPPADFDKLVESGEAQEEEFFLRYYIDSEVAQEIYDNHIKDKKLSKMELQAVSTAVWLGASPCSNRERVNEVRTKLNLDNGTEQVH